MKFRYLQSGLFLLFQFSIMGCHEGKDITGLTLKGNRFLTFNTVIRVNQIEVARDMNVGRDERDLHTPEKAIRFREAIEKGFPGARITWAFSWLALHDTTANYRKIRELVVGYHYCYGHEITFIPGAYFANAYNPTEQVNRDLHDGLNKVSEITGNGYRPKSVLTGFLSAKNQEYLASEEGIHVCQGTIWSQFAIDNQYGDGSVCYPYYPSKEHFCKPALYYSISFRKMPYRLFSNIILNYGNQTNKGILLFYKNSFPPNPARFTAHRPSHAQRIHTNHCN